MVLTSPREDRSKLPFWSPYARCPSLPILKDANIGEGEWENVKMVSLDYVWRNFGVFDFRKKPVSML